MQVKCKSLTIIVLKARDQNITYVGSLHKFHVFAHICRFPSGNGHFNHVLRENSHYNFALGNGDVSCFQTHCQAYCIVFGYALCWKCIFNIHSSNLFEDELSR